MVEVIREGVGRVRTTLREPYPDEPCAVEEGRDLSVIYERLQSVRESIAKIAIRAEEDVTRISGPVPCWTDGDEKRDKPDSVVGLLNDELDNIQRGLVRLDDVTSRFSNL